MRAATLFAAASALLLSAVAASDVLDLHKDDFNDVVFPEELMLVEFFARESSCSKAIQSRPSPVCSPEELNLFHGEATWHSGREGFPANCTS